MGAIVKAEIIQGELERQKGTLDGNPLQSIPDLSGSVRIAHEIRLSNNSRERRSSRQGQDANSPPINRWGPWGHELPRSGGTFAPGQQRGERPSGTGASGTSCSQG